MTDESKDSKSEVNRIEKEQGGGERPQGISPVSQFRAKGTNVRTYVGLAAAGVLVAGAVLQLISNAQENHKQEAAGRRGTQEALTAAQSGAQPLKVTGNAVGVPPTVGGVAPSVASAREQLAFAAGALATDPGNVRAPDSTRQLDEILASRSSALADNIAFVRQGGASVAAPLDPFGGPAMLAPGAGAGFAPMGSTAAQPDIVSGMAQAKARLDETRAHLDRLLGAASGEAPAAPSEGGTNLEGIKPTSTARIGAARLVAPSLTLPRGTNFTCALMNRIVSEESGPVSCVVARNVYGHDGRVLLIERGSHLDGAYHASSRVGQSRIAVAWERLRMPNGVIVDLGSPATGPLGEAGVDGFVDNHWSERIGAALLLSFLDDAVKIEIAQEQARGNASGTVLLQGSGSETSTMTGKVLDSTINMAPTIVKNQGEIVAVNVSRDVDFSGVYELRASN